LTLLPGTVILTGTPEGVGFTRQPPVFLKEGDRVTISIEKTMKRNLVEKNVGKFPRQVQLDKIDMGNLTPGISVEGFEKETDQRRGKGVYKKILAAMENLRSEGVPFGVSITAMRHNWDLVSSDEFYDFWFNRQDVTPCVFVPYAATNIYDIYKNGGTLDDVLHTCH
jgi:hypothetical protein